MKMLMRKFFCIKKLPLRQYFCGLAIVSLVFVGMPSCSPKSGCKATENMGPPVDKNGQLSRKGGKTKLFKN